MNNTIWKYQLEIVDVQEIQIPAGAELLCVQTQFGIPCLWARVNPSANTVNRRLITHGTGHAVAVDAGLYIGSYQLDGGALIFHVFESSS